MLPQNTLSSPAKPSAFLPPKPTNKQSVRDYFLGGIAIGDTSAGTNAQTWTAQLDSTLKKVQYFSLLTGTVDIFTAAQPIVWMSAAFDQSMRPIVSWTDVLGNSYYYWYDSTVPAFVTSALAAGVITPYATLDDARPQESTINDALVTYITADGYLKYRQQRDRFAAEYTLTAIPSPSPTFGPAQLTQVGLNLNYRMQYQFQYPALGLQAWPPVLLSDLIGAIPRIWPIEDDITAHSQKAR